MTYSLDQLEDVSKHILKNAESRVFLFFGEMGVGKTTLIKALVKALGSEDNVSSPTYSLVNEYLAGEKSIYHFDFYRLNHPDEALDIGLEEYLDSSYPCFIEWGERVLPHLPLHYDHFTLTQETSTSRVLEKHTT